MAYSNTSLSLSLSLCQNQESEQAYVFYVFFYNIDGTVDNGTMLMVQWYQQHTSNKRQRFQSSCPCGNFPACP